MSLLPLKFLVTPLLMWLVSIAGRRWGGLVGGLIAGMPLTSGPISVYLALEQGASFAGRSATGALIGIGAVMVSYAIYAVISAALNAVGSTIVALIAYSLTAYILFSVGSATLSIIVSALAFLIIVRSKTMGSAPSVVASLPTWDLPARMAASTALVVAVTGSAGQLGPSLSGLLSPIPVIAWPLLVFAHIQGGRAEALATIRGTAAGCCGIVVFNLMVAHGLDRQGPVATYVLAFGFSCLASVLIGLAMRRRKPSVPRPTRSA